MPQRNIILRLKKMSDNGLKDADSNDTDRLQGLHHHLQGDVIKEALASGLDLREYSKKVFFHSFSSNFELG